jgi:hypothetical protein
LYEAIGGLTSLTAGGKRKQDACHNLPTDTDALGVFCNAKPFLQRQMKESIGVLQRHQSADGSEGLHEQQAFAKSELLVVLTSAPLG